MERQEFLLEINIKDFHYQVDFQFRGGENQDENYTGSELQTGNQVL